MQRPTLLPIPARVPPPAPPPPPLPPVRNTPKYVTDEVKHELLKKYGNLGKSRVAPHVNTHSALIGLGALAQDPADEARRRQLYAEMVPRKEYEERVAALEQRVSLLAMSLRARDEAHSRLEATMNELLSKVAHSNTGMGHPRGYDGADGLHGIMGGGVPHGGVGHGGHGADVGGGHEIDPTGGGHGLGGAPAGMGGGMMMTGGLGRRGGEEEGEEEDVGAGMGMEDGEDGEDGLGALLGGGTALGSKLAGLEAVADEDMEAAAGEKELGEAGVLTVPGRGMLHVRLNLKYREPPVVIAYLLPPRPPTSSSPGGSPNVHGGVALDGPHAALAEKLRVCVPFKDTSSFTLQVHPPCGMDQQVAYIVIESGAHCLEGGARLIAGETLLTAGESVSMQFEVAFDSCPAVLTTNQAGSTRLVRATCELADQFGFALSLLKAPVEDAKKPKTDLAVAVFGDNQKWSEAEVTAATKLQSIARGRSARFKLSNPLRRSDDEGGDAVASVGWLACDGSGGDGVLSGVADGVKLGEWTPISFGVDYPDTPVFLCGLMRGDGRPVRCSVVQERGVQVLVPKGDAAGADADGAGAGDDEGERVGWVALPQGKLWALDGVVMVEPEEDDLEEHEHDIEVIATPPASDAGDADHLDDPGLAPEAAAPSAEQPGEVEPDPTNDEAAGAPAASSDPPAEA